MMGIMGVMGLRGFLIILMPPIIPNPSHDSTLSLPPGETQ